MENMQMSCNIRHRAGWLFATLAAVLMAGSGHATVLSLDTGKSVTIQQSGSATFTFSATNDAGAITDNFLGWTIGFQVVPLGTTAGSLTVGSLSQPLTNPMPAGSLDFTQPILATLANSGTINGLTQYYAMGVSSNDVLQTVNSLTSYNLGSVGFTASPTASGTWAVYAVQQSGALARSYWTDGVFSDSNFGNLPNTGNLSVQIGTITAVPEPSTIALLGMSMASAGWYAWRTRRKVTVEIVEAS
jgi:hypothetical protein